MVCLTYSLSTVSPLPLKYCEIYSPYSRAFEMYPVDSPYPFSVCLSWGIPMQILPLRAGAEHLLAKMSCSSLPYPQPGLVTQ